MAKVIPTLYYEHGKTTELSNYRPISIISANANIFGTTNSDPI